MPGYVSVLAHTEAEVRDVLQFCTHVQVRKNKNGMYGGNGRWVGPPTASAPVAVAPQVQVVPETTAARAALSQAVEVMLDHCFYVKKLMGDG